MQSWAKRTGENGNDLWETDLYLLLVLFSLMMYLLWCIPFHQEFINISNSSDDDKENIQKRTSRTPHRRPLSYQFRY